MYGRIFNLSFQSLGKANRCTKSVREQSYSNLELQIRGGIEDNSMINFLISL